MSGPIVRTGTNPKFWANWDNVFGKGQAKSTGKKAAGGAAPKGAAKKKAATRKKKA